MLAFMWQDDLTGVASFVNACPNKVKPPLRGGQHLMSLVWLDGISICLYLIRESLCLSRHRGYRRGSFISKEMVLMERTFI